MEPIQQSPEQRPLAFLYGQAITDLPQDLYIPPDALEVFLEAFEGPMDLLLYLIKRQNLDILDINVADITRQYINYIELMKAFQLELAAEYLLMAAMLAEIKSRVLLPRPKQEGEQEEADPRAALIRRLQEYERFKKAAEGIDQLPRLERDFYLAQAEEPDYIREKPAPLISMQELLRALKDVMLRAEMFERHRVQREPLSVREKMTAILDRIRDQSFIAFKELFTPEEGRLGVVVSFMAILELLKEALIEIIQTEVYGPIHIKARMAA